MNFLIRIKNAIVKLEEYEKFSEEKLSISIMYFLKLMLIFAVVLAVAFTYRIYSDPNVIHEELANIDTAAVRNLLENMEEVSDFALYSALFGIVLVGFFSLHAILTFIDVVLISILGFLVSKILRINFRYLPILNMAFHAITLPVILAMIYLSVNMVTGFEVRFFRLAYDAIAYIYILAAILIIKNDLMKRQMELIKIGKVQKEVVEEINKKREKKDEEKDDQKDGKKEKKQKEETVETPEPEGSQA